MASTAAGRARLTLKPGVEPLIRWCYKAAGAADDDGDDEQGSGGGGKRTRADFKLSSKSRHSGPIPPGPTFQGAQPPKFLAEMGLSDDFWQKFRWLCSLGGDPDGSFIPLRCPGGPEFFFVGS